MRYAPRYDPVHPCILLPGAKIYAQDTVINRVRVIFGVEKKMFPSRWHMKGVDVHATPIETAAIPRAKSVVNKAISKYPSCLPSAYLKKVRVFKTLQFYGYPYGGYLLKKDAVPHP